MKFLNALVLLVAFVVMQGCAFTPAQLNVAPTPDTHVAGPLGEVKSMQFATPQLEDARPDKARIGWKKNGLGENTADITTTEPVDHIVENAVKKALTDTHHTAGEGGKVEVVGTVDRFWFDLDVNFWTVKFIGDIECTLEFVNSETKESIYKSKYSGNYAEEKAGGLEATWTAVMNKTLDKLIEDVVLDEELANALKALGES
jgi:uncharacterized lipoprotein YajG